MTSRMSRAVRVLAVIFVTIAIGLVVVLVLAMTPWGNERVRRLAVSQANSRLNGVLTIEKLRGNLFRGATLTNVRVTDSGKHEVFSAKRVQVRYALLAAIRGNVVIHSVVLDTANILLDKPPGCRCSPSRTVRRQSTFAHSLARCTPRVIRCGGVVRECSCQALMSVATERSAFIGQGFAST